MKYGIIQDSKLILTTDTRQYGGEQSKELTMESYDSKSKTTVKSVEQAKPVIFAPIPKDFNQESQAIYQDAPVDKGDYIEAGVIVVDLPEELEPIIEEPITKK